MPFWGGSLTLLGAAPGIGKTSWLLGMLMEASAQKISSVLACYEHTPEELLFRLQAQAVASIAGPHDELNDSQKAEEVLAKSATGLVLSLNDREDTIPGIEKTLLKTYGFPPYGYAFVAVDYLQRIPVVGTTGLVSEAYRGGEAAAELRKMARRHNWAVIATAAISQEKFSEKSLDLSSLLGDERIAYEADRVVMMEKISTKSCGCCYEINIRVIKDRTDALRDIKAEFWGKRFYVHVG